MGIREFRGGLAKYLSEAQPVGITKNSKVVGYYIPTADTQTFKAELERLKATMAKMETFLNDLGVSEEEIHLEFGQHRKTTCISEKRIDK